LDLSSGMLERTGFQFCPRCGSREIANHDVKAMRCLQCRYTYYHNAAAAVAAILETPKGILLTRRQIDPHAGRLDLPGGFVDYEESFELALAREIREELHLDLGEMKYFGSYPNRYLFGGTTYFTADVVFVCPLQDISSLIYNDEIAEVVFFEKSRIPPTQVGFSSMRKALELYSQL
jgi:NADH pyrophosphatase NudC (nudix superfamily)